MGDPGIGDTYGDIFRNQSFFFSGLSFRAKSGYPCFLIDPGFKINHFFAFTVEMYFLSTAVQQGQFIVGSHFNGNVFDVFLHGENSYRNVYPVAGGEQAGQGYR